MNTKILLPLAAIAMLTLAACSDPKAPAEAATEAAPAAEVAPAAAPAAEVVAPAAEVVAPAAEVVAPAVVPAVPAMAPAVPAANNTTAVTPEQALQALQTQAASMTEAQKLEAVAAARKAAEDAAKAQGLTADQIKQAGDMAEAAAKQALGVL